MKIFPAHKIVSRSDIGSAFTSYSRVVELEPILMLDSEKQGFLYIFLLPRGATLRDLEQSSLFVQPNDEKA